MIGAIVLAAGSSRRFGNDKRRAKLPNGKLVIQHRIKDPHSPRAAWFPDAETLRVSNRDGTIGIYRIKK